MKPCSVYIHIPFCSHKCLFCSFAIAVSQAHRADDYLNRLEDEAKQYQKEVLDTVYVGGGTPSLLSTAQLQRLMGIVRENFLLKDDCEITIEANPESIDQDKADAIKDLGFNRISLGAQTLDDRFLRFLGRKHTVTQAKEAYTILKTAGFKNINMDLMYGFPSQTEEELQADTHAIAQLGSEHLSLYTLTIEPNSRFYAQALKLDDDQKLAVYYQKVIGILSQYGFRQYEVSNFARPGFESRHNKNYWQGGEYIGLGMGAHGFLGKRRYWNKASFQEYLKSPETIEGFEDLSDQTLIMEKVLFGLRMNEGIEVPDIPQEKKAILEGFIKEGFLSQEGGRLKATDQGRLWLDELSARLV